MAGRFQAGRFARARFVAGRFAGQTAAELTQTLDVNFGTNNPAGSAVVDVVGEAIAAGDPSGDFQVAGRQLSLSATGVGTTPGLRVLTTDEGQEVRVTILDNTTVVTSESELQAAYVAAGAAGGTNILLRNMPGGITTVPSSIVELARNLTFAQPVVLEAEPGATIERISFREASNIIVRGVEVYDRQGSPLISPVSLIGACADVVFEDLEVHGVQPDLSTLAANGWTSTNTGISSGTLGSGPSERGPRNVIIRRCEVYHCKQGIVMDHWGGVAGLLWEHNDVHHCFTDTAQLACKGEGLSTPKVIRGNTWRNGVGLGSDFSNPHADCFQISAVGLDGVYIAGFNYQQNIHISDGQSRADEYAGLVLFTGGQSGTEGPIIDDPVIAWNVFLLKGTNVLAILKIRNGKVYNNTLAASHLGHQMNGPQAIQLGEILSEGTIHVQNNIAESISLLGAATYNTSGNIEMGDEGATVPYASVFDGPTFTDPVSHADVLARYRMKAGGPADRVSPAKNAGAIGASALTTFGDRLSSVGWAVDDSFAPITTYVQQFIDNQASAGITRAGGFGGTYPAVTISMWLKPHESLTGGKNILDVDGRIALSTAHRRLSCVFKDSLGATLYSDSAATNDTFTLETLTHLYVMAEYDDGSGNQELIIATNGVPLTMLSPLTNFTGGSGLATLARNTGILCTAAGGVTLDTDAADIMIFGERVELADLWNGGTAPSPASLSAVPILRTTGPAASAGSNLGSGDDGVLVGTFADAA